MKNELAKFLGGITVVIITLFLVGCSRNEPVIEFVGDGRWQTVTGEYVNSEIIADTKIRTTAFQFGDDVARCDWSTGILECEGDLGEGAKLFFEYLSDMYGPCYNQPNIK